MHDHSVPASLTLAELKQNSDIVRLQRESSDLLQIINYLSTGTLPAHPRSAQILLYDIDSWTIEDDVFHHIYNFQRRNVNSVKPVIKQLAVPVTLRHKVLTSFHNDNGHFRLDKSEMTILQHYYWKGMYAVAVSSRPRVLFL